MKALLLFALATIAISAQAQTNVEASAKLTTTSVNDEGEHLLADTRGNTLYVFDIDLSSTVSKCNGICAELWPAYLLTEAEAAAVTAPLGVVIRDSKKLQLTYSGRPVYTYSLDRGVAADAGDGIGGVWHYIEIKE